MMNQQRIRKLVISAVFCALVFAATWIYIPAPSVGNVNLGDGMLLLCAWMLGGPWAAVAAATGAALCDLVSGFALYAPATFVIKALMVVVAIGCFGLFQKLRLHATVCRALSAVCAELVMIVGYYLYESTVVLHSFIGAAANIPFNAVQGLFGIVLACVLYEFLARSAIL